MLIDSDSEADCYIRHGQSEKCYQSGGMPDSPGCGRWWWARAGVQGCGSRRSAAAAWQARAAHPSATAHHHAAVGTQSSECSPGMNSGAVPPPNNTQHIRQLPGYILAFECHDRITKALIKLKFNRITLPKSLWKAFKCTPTLLTEAQNLHLWYKAFPAWHKEQKYQIKNLAK